MTTRLIARHLHADLDTPVSAYLKLRKQADWSFLFESVEGNEVWAAWSIIGVGARRTFRIRQGQLTVDGHGGARTIDASDPLAALRAEAARGRAQAPPDAPPFVGGIFGFLAYDIARAYEPLAAAADSQDDDASFFEPELLAVFDNRRHRLSLFAADEQTLDRTEQALRGPVGSRTPSETPWQPPQATDDRETFKRRVDAAKEYIRAGDIIQVVLSRRFELPRVADPFDVYRGLRTINPSPYLFFLKTPGLELAGASPEVMIRVQNGRVIVRPIAGTRPRGSTADEDQSLAEELLADPKERAEHIMLVDLGRNDIGRVARPGTVDVPELMNVERYSHVMHIVSEVSGELTDDKDAYDAVRAALPAGTLSGAPKVRAMQIIDELELRRRGIYGGAVGYFGPGGDADFGIAIRTMEARHDSMRVQAGAGIVADSDPQREAEETEHKARAVIRAAQWATSDEAGW